MAGLRSFACYRKVKRAYTRKSKYKTKGYIRSVPTCKVVKFNFGNNKKEYTNKILLVSKERIQVRHNAIESARVAVVRKLNRTLGKNYHFQIRSYPHHILRENKMITGAGADRMQTGMQRAFGKAMGLAAQLKPNTAIFCIYVDKENMDAVKLALKSATPKLPCKCGVVCS
ncbi:50S ribosomal protein L16 [archaeon]|jgi:large subunit ribosomal protein L10e|nr:50S ribosomal protein L16 [archaeon]MBT3730631.1 50S ribosomal protein L16 [archaeon]MBT4669533.1 50S ribosomal protein L16 [archaeon]MBT5030290.1 50S ribosomal protein L16 [archaeon]MBT5288417.1 50S ribosomal protein L16 [archaeon]